MKNLLFQLIICCFFISLLSLVACNSGPVRDRNRVYMPDMGYPLSYSDATDGYDFLKKEGINYVKHPVSGTIYRGESLPVNIKKDLPGDTTQYFLSNSIKNPINSLTPFEYKETERLYLIYCGICHGKNIDGNGPLYNGGSGPFPAKPATLVGDIYYDMFTEGRMYYSVTFGKNLMGSYATLLTREQRWKIIYYIKQKQLEDLAKKNPNDGNKVNNVSKVYNVRANKNGGFPTKKRNLKKL
ncbi:MAG: cytochrome c [Phycisphaerales bacterium]|nr:cytochrome c [Phycisphaerales bacterium]